MKEEQIMWRDFLNKIALTNEWDQKILLESLLMKAGVPSQLYQEFHRSILGAKLAQERVKKYRWLAPLKVIQAVRKTPWTNEEFPAQYRKYDFGFQEHIDINGDKKTWFLDENGRGQPEPMTLNPLAPEAFKQCYWTKGKFHPRSMIARYIWAGIRNRANRAQYDEGTSIISREVSYWTYKDKDVHVRIYRNSGQWQMIVTERWYFGLKKRIHLGWKIFNAFEHDSVTGTREYLVQRNKPHMEPRLTPIYTTFSILKDD